MKPYELLFMLLILESWYFNCCALMQLLNTIFTQENYFSFSWKRIALKIIFHCVHQSLINILKAKKNLRIKTNDVKKNRNPDDNENVAKQVYRTRNWIFTNWSNTWTMKASISMWTWGSKERSHLIQYHCSHGVVFFCYLILSTFQWLSLWGNFPFLPKC